MTELTRTIAHDLALALRHYLSGAEEVARLRAYEIARDAMTTGVGVLEMAAGHQEALAILLSGAWTPEESLRAAKASAELLAESLGPFEMAHRGFQEANASLLRVKADLERQIVEREQAEAAARLAGEQAERANTAKSEFLSRMSHELRTPLNAVLGFGQLLEMDPLNEEQRENVEQILKGGKHLLELINEVLDIARIESGRISLSMEPVLVDETVNETVALIQPLAAERGISLHVEVPSGIGYVRADRQRMKQVLLNLLSNGVKYNRQGGSLSLRCVSDPVTGVRMDVRDDGPGISQDGLRRLFVPFDRLGAEQSGVEGTGLGLALSKRLTEAMGGTLEVKSALGKGSTFSLCLPTTDAPEQLLEAAEEIGRSPSEPVGEIATLLYVEDNPANLKLIERVMATQPAYRLLSAMQGGLGVDLARQHHPDLVLLDLNLPDMSGGEVLRRLQNDPQTKDIPVIVISADATKDRVRSLLAAGATAYLTKPLNIRGLLDVVGETLKEAEA
jgi:signal transduction histidine kinase/ActR/RegA family two-component response regulator